MLSDLHRHFDTFKGCPIRTKGWERFQQLGLPEKKQEAFQYVPLKDLYSQSFELSQTIPVTKADIQSAVVPECLQSHLVFINGHLSLELSDVSGLPSQVVLLPLAEAFRTHSQLLNSRLNKSLSEEKDPFTALNLALHAEGAFLYIPPKTVLATPIQCLHITTGGVAIHPRLHLFIGSQTHVKWINSALEMGEPSLRWINAVTDVALEEGASFKAVDLILPQADTWCFKSLRATLKKDSHLQHVSVSTGSKSVRQDFRIALAGVGAEARLQGIAMLSGRNQSHVHILMDHQERQTQSMQLFKGILGDTSRSSFEGKILVRQPAQKTQAYQLNNHLILSENAIANSKPNLEIFADDVKASHGATVAQIDPAQLFYLNTRGIDEAFAKRLLVSGFCQEILTQIPHLSIAGQLQNLLNTYLTETASKTEK